MWLAESSLSDSRSKLLSDVKRFMQHIMPQLETQATDTLILDINSDTVQLFLTVGTRQFSIDVTCGSRVPFFHTVSYGGENERESAKVNFRTLEEFKQLILPVLKKRKISISLEKIRGAKTGYELGITENKNNQLTMTHNKHVLTFEQWKFIEEHYDEING